jgi:hypothetical protein
MTAIIKNKFRLRNARGFVDNFNIPQVHEILSTSTLTESQKLEILGKVANRNHYLFVGKPFGWDTTQSTTDTNTYGELNPEPPVDHTEYDARIWDEMLGLKKISRGDVSLVIPRSDWRPNTVYAPYDDQDPMLYQQPTVERIRNQTPTKRAGNFYVLTKLFELFICIDNNNGAVSQEEPSRPPSTEQNSNENGRFELDDGYVWQYVTSIGPLDAVKFLTDSWIPIRTIPENANIDHPQEDIQANSIPGELLRVEVTSDGATGNFAHTYVGKIERVPSNSQQAIFTQSQTNPIPSNLFAAYKGYEIHITIPEVTGGSPQHVKRYTITNYTSVPFPLLTLDGVLSELELAIPYDCQILPLIQVETNGNPVSVKPITDVAGRLTAVEILDHGSDATTMKMSIHRPDLFEGDLPTVRPILSPPQGLCKDPESDLGAFFVMVSTQLKYDEGEGDFPVANDYRQLGIIRDVKKLAKNSQDQDVEVLATDNTLNATVVVNVRFNSPGDVGNGFQSDQEVLIRPANNPLVTLGKARVVQFIRNPDVGDLIWGKLYLLQTKETGYYNIEENQVFVASPGANEVKATSFNTTDVPAVVREEFLKFHGDILYIENRRAVLRSKDQIEDIKTIIEF